MVALMKKKVTILKFCINLPLIILLYLSALLLCVLLPQPNFEILLGMPQSDVAGDIDYLLFARWIILMTIPLIVNGVIMERSTKIELLSTIRYRSRRSFRESVLIACWFNTIIWVLVYILLAAVFIHGTSILSFSLVTASGFLMWATVGFALFYITGRKSWSGVILIFLIGGTYLLGERSPELAKFMPGMWIMTCRTTVCQKTGFAAIYFIAMNLLITAVSGVLLFRKGGKYGNNMH